MAFDFDALKPEAKRAAFAHMRLGSGARHKRLSSKKKAAVEHGGKGTVSGKLGSGTVKGKLSPADADSGSVGGRLPIAKARPPARKPAAPAKSATPKADTPEARFDDHVTSQVRDLTKGGNDYAGLVDMRKSLDATGMSRAEQDQHLKRMSREGKLHIVPEDNRKALRQEDHDAAIHIGGEPNHLVSLPEDRNHPNAAPRTSAPAPVRSTDPKKLAESRTPAEYKTLAESYLESHGSDGVAFKIKQLEKRQKLSPGQRAQLAALKSLGNK